MLLQTQNSNRSSHRIASLTPKVLRQTVFVSDLQQLTPFFRLRKNAASIQRSKGTDSDFLSKEKKSA